MDLSAKSTLDLIMSYEGGDATDEETLELFSRLIRTGQAWTLQGFYGRAAAQLIEQGWISPEGEVMPIRTEPDCTGVPVQPESIPA